MKIRSIFIEIIVFLLILLFTYTGLSKWLDYNEFYRQMANQPFDNKYVPLLVWGIPGLEFIATGLLIFNKTRLYGLYLSAFLMAIFTGYVGLVLAGFYSRTPCSCGGAIQRLSWSQHLIFNSFFLVISIIGIFLFRKRNQNLHTSLAQLA